MAFGLAAVAICLIAFGSHRETQLGVIAGLWSAFFGAVSIYGVRHAPPAPAHLAENGGSELEPAQRKAVASRRDAEYGREYEERLQSLVQAELGKLTGAMAGELNSLRQEVAQLRGELLEKVGGQLRLERVEATRVIGSNIDGIAPASRSCSDGAEPL